MPCGETGRIRSDHIARRVTNQYLGRSAKAVSLEELFQKLNCSESTSRIQSPGLALVFSDDEIRAARHDGRLLSLDIELTEQCNLRCLYCYAAGGKRRGKGLLLPEIIGVIDEARTLGLRTLNLTGGEPLLDERYFAIAEHARKHGISVLLFTNGTRITRAVANRLAELNISPCVKLDSLSPDVQDYLAGRRATLEAIEEGIGSLISAGYTTKYPLSVNAVVCRQNYGGIPDMWNWARGHNVVPSITRLQPMGRANRRLDQTVPAGELRELFVRLSEIDRGHGIRWEPNVPWVYSRACRRHFVGCFVNLQGYVQPCSGVPIKAGNIREQSLGEVLRSADIFRIARNMEDYVEGGCRTCEHKTDCYGCRSVAYFTSGSFTAADPLCWHNQERQE